MYLPIPSFHLGNIQLAGQCVVYIGQGHRAWQANYPGNGEHYNAPIRSSVCVRLTVSVNPFCMLLKQMCSRPQWSEWALKEGAVHIHNNLRVLSTWVVSCMQGVKGVSGWFLLSFSGTYSL